MERAIRESWPIKLPETLRSSPASGSFTDAEFQKIVWGFIPEDDRDAWFVYLDGDGLYFHQRETGDCWFVLRLVRRGLRYDIVELLVNDTENPLSDRGTEKLMHFLIDRLFFDKPAIVPRFDDMDALKRKICLSFFLDGRIF